MGRTALLPSRTAVALTAVPTLAAITIGWAVGTAVACRSSIQVRCSRKGSTLGGCLGVVPPPAPEKRRALTVSELTDRIQGVLETEFLDVWVEGEVSNLKFMPSSGHFYF